MTRPLSLLALVREDWETANRRTMLPGLHALVVHRFGVWCREQPAPLRQLGRVLYKLANNLLIRNVYGIEIWDSTQIGRRVLIGHHMGVVLGGGSVIGDDVLVRQNVTLGQAADGGAAPRIGDGVELGAGAVVIGGVTVGPRARIGPGAVVLTDVPAGAVAVAPTSRILRPPATGGAA